MPDVEVLLSRLSDPNAQFTREEVMAMLARDRGYVLANDTTYKKEGEVTNEPSQE